MSNIAKEIWIALLMEGLVPDTSFLSRSVDMSALVEYSKINLGEAGVDPDVLIDNSVFPVPTAERPDTPIELLLHTFDTKNTVVRNIEQMEASTDKMQSVLRGHRNALIKKTSAFAAYNWCPTKDSAYTPVLAGAGSVNPSGYKRVSFEDFLTLETKYRGMDVDLNSLVAVLDPIHLADLRAEDMKLYKEVLASGKLFSFSLFSTSVLPKFNLSTGQKKAFGAALDAANDMPTSIVYSDTEVMRAVGDVDMFAKFKDPEHRGDVVGFQQRFTALSIRNKYNGAIYSGK